MQKLASSSLQDGSLVVADYQTHGRGQRNTSWESTEGMNLTFTIALFPNLLVSQQFYLNIMTSLAITDCLQNHVGNLLKIKWPNDIYYVQSKLCGILVQNNLKVNKIQSSAVGIGLNVNQTEFNDKRAASVKSVSGKTWNRMELLRELVSAMEVRYFQLKDQQFARLRRAYLNRLFWKDEWHTYKDKVGVFRGVIIGLNEGGQLMIQRGDRLQAYSFKEVVFVE